MRFSSTILASKPVQGMPFGLSFTSDGQHLIVEAMTIPRVGIINLLNPQTLEQVNAYSTQDKFSWGFTVNPSSNNIATFGSQGAVVRDVLTGNILASTPQMCFECGCYSPDGKKLILSKAERSLFTFDIESQTLIEGRENYQAATSICPVSEDTYLLATVAEEGSMFWFSVMDESGVMRSTAGRLKGKDFYGSSLIASFDAHHNRMCVVDNRFASVFSYPEMNWRASFSAWGEFVHPDDGFGPEGQMEDWSNPVFLGASGILACGSTAGILLLDLNSNQLLGYLDEHQGGQMLAYHEGSQLLASIDGNGMCVVRQISITE